MKVFNQLLAVASFSLALAAVAGSALASEGQPAMRFGQPALAPAGYLEFCRRQPGDCGAEPAQVLAQVAKAQADQASLLVAPGPSAVRISSAPQPQAQRLATQAAPALDASLWSC